MHTGPVEGKETGDWKPTKAENPQFTCSRCKSDNVWYVVWESSCGGYEDIHYQCRACNRDWWVESSDS